MEFQRKSYEQALYKVLEMAERGYWYFASEAVNQQVSIAKTYLWVAIVVYSSGMYLFGKITPNSLQVAFISLAMAFYLVGFGCALLVLLGKGSMKMPFIDVLSLAEFAYNRADSGKDIIEIYQGYVKMLDKANRHNANINERRAVWLRRSIFCLLISVFLLSVSAVLVVLNV